MTIKWACVVVAACWSLAVPAWAQTIHGHPQKAAYASPAEWPTFSTQCHWSPANDMPGMQTGHTHVDLQAPFYAELTGPVVVPFAIKLFHTDGVAFFDSSEGIRDIVFDEPGPMLGDPMGLKVYTGHLTLDPTLRTRWFTLHGGWGPIVAVTTLFSNGDFLSTRVLPSFYVTLDASADETPSGAFYSARCNPKSSRHPDVAWGDNLVETSQFLPIAPINQPWMNVFVTAGYGGNNLPPAVFEQRVDLDLHNGVPGTILKTIAQVGDINTAAVIDPAQIGSGSHKMAFFRNQVSPDGTEEVTTLLVIDAVVGAGVPPPPPPPPPTATWLTVTSVTQRLGDLIRVCDLNDGKCLVLGTVTAP